MRGMHAGETLAQVSSTELEQQSDQTDNIARVTKNGLPGTTNETTKEGITRKRKGRSKGKKMERSKREKG